jgi:hypothetical protein
LIFTKSYITRFRAIYKSVRINLQKTDIVAAVRPSASPIILHFRQFIGPCWQASASGFTVISSHEGEPTMKHANFRSFAASMEDVAQDIVEACRRGARTIATMPWPAMLACCIVLAFVISILPLALFLFVLFMGLKVVIGAFAVDHHRAHREQFGDHCGKQ